MTFTNRRYLTNEGNIFQLRMSDALFLVQGTEPPGSITDSKVFAKRQTAGRARSKDLSPRGVVFSRTAAVPGETRRLVVSLFVPCLSPANQVALFAAGSLTYKGFTWIPQSTVSEV